MPRINCLIQFSCSFSGANCFRPSSGISSANTVPPSDGMTSPRAEFTLVSALAKSPADGLYSALHSFRPHSILHHLLHQILAHYSTLQHFAHYGTTMHINSIPTRILYCWDIHSLHIIYQLVRIFFHGLIIYRNIVYVALIIISGIKLSVLKFT